MIFLSGVFCFRPGCYSDGELLALIFALGVLLVTF